MWISSPLKALSTPCSERARRIIIEVAVQSTKLLTVDTYWLIKVHVVGEDVDVGVEDSSLPNHLFQDVSYPSGEDEQRDAVLMQVVEEELEALPAKAAARNSNTPPK